MSGVFKGRIVRQCGGKNNGYDDVTTICFSAGDEMLISCHKEKAFIHKFSSLEQVGKLEGHRAEITCCAAAHDLLATGAKNGIVHLWKFRDLKRVARLCLPKSPINSVTLSKSSFLLAVAYSSEKTRVYSLYGNDGTLVQGSKFAELEGSDGGVSTVQFSEHNENILLSSSSDGAVKIWDCGTGGIKFHIEPELGPISTIAFFGGASIAFLTESNGLQVWGIESKEKVWEVNGSFKLLGASDFSQELAVVDDSNTLKCYNIPLQKETLRKGTTHEGPITACLVTSSGRNIVTSATDGKLFVWE